MPALSAVDRIKCNYTVDGVPHVSHTYVELSGGLSGGYHELLDRDGVTTTSWPLCFERFVSQVLANFSVIAAAPLGTLEHRTGLVWNPTEFYTSTHAGVSGTVSPASQLTVVCRDTLFFKVRVTLMEGKFGYVGHSANGYGIASAIDQIADAINGTDADPFGFFRWAQSKSALYLNPSGTIAGATLDLNDKLKRTRHLE